MASGVAPVLMQLVGMFKTGSAPGRTQAVCREAAFQGRGGEVPRFMEEAGSHPWRGLGVGGSITHSLCKETCSAVSVRLYKDPRAGLGRGNMLFFSVKWMWSQKSWCQEDLGSHPSRHMWETRAVALFSSPARPKLQLGE